MIERGAAPDFAAPARRSSTANVSRPAGEQSSLLLRAGLEPGAFVEWELGPVVAGTPDPSLVLECDDSRRVLELRVEPVGSAAGPPSAWRRFRAPLAELVSSETPESPASLEYRPRERDSGPLRSRPRVYGHRDRGRHPSVVWIVLDTVRADYLGCYGHDRPTSPRIDAFARRSLLFERAVSPASWTLPAMASMLTGLYGESHGVLHTEQRLDGRFTSVVELFASAGYTTGAVVSGTFTDSFWGFDQGFDEYDDLGMVVDDEDGGSTAVAAMERRAHRRITSPEVTERALAFLERHLDKRFFLLAHYFDPHQDFVVHPGLTERFGPRPAASTDFGGQDPDPARTARLRADYEGEIAFTDEHLGRLLARLEASPFQGEVVIVISADHGEEFYERQWLGHGNSLFNELVHVPLILHVPGVSPRRSAEPVSTLDLAPTLLELCGLPADFGQGRSLVPLFAAGGTRPERAVYSSLFASLAPAPGETGPQLAWRVDQGDDAVLRDERQPQVPYFLFHWPDDPLQERSLGPRGSARARELLATYERARPGLLELRGRPDLLQLSPELLETLRALGYVGGDE
jgi:arylsulfatase A-like enzyme